MPPEALRADSLRTLGLVHDGHDQLGRCVPGAGTRIFGGHSLAQSICVAADWSERPIASLHAVFVSPGDARSPVRYRARRLKLGRTIDVVRVEGEQRRRQVLTVDASFAQPEASPDFYAPGPLVPRPLDYPPTESGHHGQARAVREPFVVHSFPPDEQTATVDTWLRLRAPLAEEPENPVHAAWLAYAVDFLITRPAHLPSALSGRSAIGASLNHAMWFHRPARVDEWLLVRARLDSFSGSRSLCRATVYDDAGTLVATAAQEALVRRAED